MYFGHIGDSRIYHLPARAAGIKQLSEDHTHVGWLFRNGQISEHEARTHPRRGVLQNALGGENQFVDPQVGAVAYGKGDIFLLCTDGLIDGLDNRQLVEILRAYGGSAQILVDASIKNSGRDNTTALVIQTG
jgi:protein phosphatase